MTDRVLNQIHFPHINSEGYFVTSPRNKSHNCIAWAAHDQFNWWWPGSRSGYWPIGIPRAETVPTFVAAFKTLGYMPCPHGRLQRGYEKIAIYALNDVPKHAARQLPTGKWTSKIGKYKDIEHTLRALEGPFYGYVTQYLARSA